MTICTERGYAVGEEFEVINENNFHCFSIGDIVVLVYDDGTDKPDFKRDDGLVQYVSLKDVRKLNE